MAARASGRSLSSHGEAGRASVCGRRHTRCRFQGRCRLDLDGELVALAYRFRWAVELFFRWLKCILGCRHLLANSREGVTMQVYLALIASLLISLWAGRKPSVRTLEMIQFYFQGWANEAELTAHLNQIPPPRK